MTIRPSSSTIALMYHAVDVRSGPGVDPHYSVTLERFNQHVAACIRIRDSVLCLQDWLDGRDGVVLTFDDGHESNYRLAWPALTSVGGRADFFVNPAQVGTQGYATWAQLREMSDGGMSIQSHGLDHSHYLTELSPARLREELRRARLEIEDHTGQRVTLLSPPGGRQPQDIERVAQEVGYSHVLVSRPTAIGRRPRCKLGRFAVTDSIDVASLESWLSERRARLKMQLRYGMLDAAKRVLGDRRYERIRAGLLRR